MADAFEIGLDSEGDSLARRFQRQSQNAPAAATEIPRPFRGGADGAWLRAIDARLRAAFDEAKRNTTSRPGAKAIAGGAKAHERTAIVRPDRFS